MIYCHAHEKAFIPAGFDQHLKAHMPAHWEPLPWHLVAWAWRWAVEGHCTRQLRIDRPAPCDVCQGEETRFEAPRTAQAE